MKKGLIYFDKGAVKLLGWNWKEQKLEVVVEQENGGYRIILKPTNARQAT